MLVFLSASCSFGGSIRMEGVLVFLILYLCLGLLAKYRIVWYSP